MNGAHDLGGMHGFGPIDPEPDEPVFHHEWERRCFALTLAAGFLGRWNIDISRHARERMDPAHYLDTTYYEHWLHGLETLLVERGLVSAEELESARSDGTRSAAAERCLPASAVDKVLRAGGPANVDVEVPASFAIGEAVRVRNLHPTGHTRAPRYVRGRRGVVERDHGVYIFPDTHAHDLGTSPQHLYSVRFEGSELWGEDGGTRDSVRLDLWDAYLEPAR